VFSKLKNWVVDRAGWQPIRENVFDRRVAKGAWYFGDGATLMLLLGVLVTTGMFMGLTYSPSPDTAYESVRHITERQMLGWFVRGLHYWSAGLMVVMLFFHLFRQILLGGYKAPREGTWLVGVLLFFLVLVMSFTGYVLRWDERGVYALRIPLHMFSYVPWIGDTLVVLVQGGDEIGARSLTRIYAVHVLIVPLLLFLLVGYHLFLVMFHGTTSPTERQRPVGSADEQRAVYKADKESEERGEMFHPDTSAKSMTMALIVFGAVLALTLIAGPAELYPEANFIERSFPIEEWWWWWYSSMSALLPPAIAPAVYVLFPIVVFLILVLLPFVDRGPARGIRNRPIAAIIVALCVIGLLALSDLRRRSPWTGWPQADLPSIPENFELTERVERGRILFAQYGCNTCHPISGHGPRVGPDFSQHRGIWSRAEIRSYILRPPPEIPMPSYAGRLMGEDLELVIEFVHTAQTFPRDQRAR
jgi:ubiquinol-cytochrome c reductase cytochrome b subunit